VLWDYLLCQWNHLRHLGSDQHLLYSRAGMCQRDDLLCQRADLCERHYLLCHRPDLPDRSRDDVLCFRHDLHRRVLLSSLRGWAVLREWCLCDLPVRHRLCQWSLCAWRVHQRPCRQQRVLRAERLRADLRWRLSV
jgi:hypothetical protein